MKLLLLFFFQGKQGVSDVLEILKEEFKTAMILAGGKVVPFYVILSTCPMIRTGSALVWDLKKKYLFGFRTDFSFFSAGNSQHGRGSRMFLSFSELLSLLKQLNNRN